MARNVTKAGGSENKPLDEGGSQTLEGEIEQKLSPIVKDLPKVQREQIISAAVRVVKMEAFSGPLPHPRHLEDYERILPGGADRIFRLAERALESNITVHERQQKYDQNYRILGMILGFITMILIIGGAIYSGLHGYQILAGLLLGATVLGIIGVFVNAHLKK